jgi:predicted Fe-Mo cluster-binding NifX family protein
LKQIKKNVVIEVEKFSNKQNSESATKSHIKQVGTDMKFNVIITTESGRKYNYIVIYNKNRKSITVASN